MQKYRVSGTFTARMRGTKRVRIERTVEAETEEQAIDIAVEDEIAFHIGDWLDSLNVEAEDTENVKATPADALPVDVQMKDLGPKIAPRLI